MYGGRGRPFSAAEKSNRKISIISSNGLETAEMTDLFHAEQKITDFI